MVAVGALVVLAAALRFPSLAQQSYWYDEAVTVELVRSSLGGLLAQLPARESTPPLYYLLAWGWTRVFGSGELGLRSLSALIGVGTVAVVFAATRSLVSARAAVIASALVATSPMLVWYSQEARAYALLAFLAAVTVLLFARARELPTRGRLAAWAVACALAVATHYFAAFLIAGEALLLWMALPGRRRAVSVGAAGVAAVGLALLPLAIHQEATGRTGWIADSPLPARMAAALGRLFSRSTAYVSSQWSDVGGPAGLAALAIVVLAALVFAPRLDVRERAGLRLAGALAGFAVGVPLLLSVLGIDFFLHRNLIAGWVLLAIALGALLGARKAGPRGGAAAAALCLVGVAADLEVVARPDLQRADWRAAAKVLGPPERPRAVVVHPVYSAPALRVYGVRLSRFPRRGALGVREIDLVGAVRGRPPPPLAGFRLVERAKRQRLILLRYVSSSTVDVTRRELVQAGYGAKARAVNYQAVTESGE